MGAFNQGAFNLTPFNLPDEIEPYWLEIFGQERITGSTGSSMDTYISANGRERVTGSFTAVPATVVSGYGTEKVNTAAELNGYFWLNISGGDSVACTVEHGSEYYPLTLGNEAVTLESASISSDISLVNEGHEDISGEWHPTGSTIFYENESYETVDASVDLESRTELTCELNLTLKPGEKIIIDAINYNVLLENENGIHLQTGDWLDELSRSTSSVRIVTTPSSAKVSSTILYTERYL